MRLSRDISFPEIELTYKHTSVKFSRDLQFGIGQCIAQCSFIMIFKMLTYILLDTDTVLPTAKS